MEASDAKRLREEENGNLEKLLAEARFEIRVKRHRELTP
ncbi:hypothetical protein IWX58_004152 [Rubrivivax gelatinosus]|nr:hypothetical protein [Rubrivivax gelatinosus]